MKKLIVALGVGALMLGTNVLANGDAVGLIVTSGSECSLYDGNGNVVGGKIKNISYHSEGIITMTCSSIGKVAKPEKKAVTYDTTNTDGAMCWTVRSYYYDGYMTTTGYGPTDDWQNVVSASGISSLVCKYHQQKED